MGFCHLLASLVGAGFVAPPNVVVNDRSLDPPARVQSEVAMAVHDDVVVVVWNDAIGYFEDASLVGYGYSLDGGRSWTDGGELPNAPDMRVAGDPWITVASDGTFVVASVDIGNDDGIALHRGRRVDDSFAWGDISTHVRAGGEALDKPAIDHDDVNGSLYLTYVNWSQNRGELVRSDDLGETWTEPLVVHESSRATAYVPVIDRDGGVYVAWVDRVGQPNAQLYVRHSADGGTTWRSAATRFATLGPDAHEPPFGYDREVNATFPSLAVAREAAGGPRPLIAAWSDGAPGTYDVYVARSFDRGATWTAPITPRAPMVGEAFWPRVRTADDGRIVIGWYDRREPSTRSATGFAIVESVDDGATFGPTHRLSDQDVPWEGVPADFTPNFGDYIDVVTGEHRVYAAWSDARLGDPDVVVGQSVDRRAITGRVHQAPGMHRNLGGVVWPLANGARLEADASLADETTMAAAGALGLLGTFDDGTAPLSSTTRGAAGSFTVSTDASRSELSIELGMPCSSDDDTSSVSIELWEDRPNTWSAGARPARWRATLDVHRSASDSLSLDGFIDANGRRLDVTGALSLTGAAPAVPPTPESWRIVQEVAREGASFDVVTRVLAPVTGDVARERSARALRAGGRDRPDDRAEAGLTVTPNPATAIAWVDIGKIGNLAGEGTVLGVYDVTGRSVMRVAIDDARVGERVALVLESGERRAMAPGLYVVRAETSSGHVLASTKLIIRQ